MAKEKAKLYENGKWNVTNLRFLADFLTLVGGSTSDAANRIGYTRQGVYNMMMKDDAKISILQRIVNTYGYILEFSFLPKNTTQVVGGAYVDFGECIKGSVVEAKSGKRLGFLEVALSRYGITKKHVCEIMKMPESTLMYQFRNDDMSISTLYEFAEAFDLKFCINFKKDSQGHLPESEI